MKPQSLALFILLGACGGSSGAATDAAARDASELTASDAGKRDAGDAHDDAVTVSSEDAHGDALRATDSGHDLSQDASVDSAKPFDASVDAGSDGQAGVDAPEADGGPFRLVNYRGSADPEAPTWVGVQSKVPP